MYKVQCLENNMDARFFLLWLSQISFISLYIHIHIYNLYMYTCIISNGIWNSVYDSHSPIMMLFMFEICQLNSCIFSIPCAVSTKLSFWILTELIVALFLEWILYASRVILLSFSFLFGFHENVFLLYT